LINLLHFAEYFSFILVNSKTVFNTDNKKYKRLRNVSWASNHHIRLISEGSGDTEDWSNESEN